MYLYQMIRKKNEIIKYVIKKLWSIKDKITYNNFILAPCLQPSSQKHSQLTFIRFSHWTYILLSNIIKTIWILAPVGIRVRTGFQYRYPFAYHKRWLSVDVLWIRLQICRYFSGKLWHNKWLHQYLQWKCPL